jgi:RNA polymerase sigma-70 factor, ECF subfamily
VALSEIDRQLLARCLAKQPKSWEDFVDRFMGLVIHVINHSAQCRSMTLTSEDREDLVSDVFLNIVREDFAILRHFRGESSLATYLTVVTRRIVVAQLLKRKNTTSLNHIADSAHNHNGHALDGKHTHDDHHLVMHRDEIERLLGELDESEAKLVRLFHLEEKSYQEISRITGMAENSIGPTLHRAREKLRKYSSVRT